jgi:hypothetical protein
MSRYIVLRSEEEQMAPERTYFELRRDQDLHRLPKLHPICWR